MGRAQTSFDFAIGMGIFLLAVGFVLTFIPTIFQPFAVGAGADEIVGDRIAATLVEDSLVENVSRPAVLNESCTSKLFGPETGPVSGCGYENATLAGAIGSTEANVNVTIRQNGSVAEPAWADNRTLALGDPPRSGADVTISRRVVRIGGEVYELWVRVW